MAKVYEETIIELPEDVVRASCGFAYDIGGSLAKIVYRSREDYDNGVRKTPQGDGSMGRVRMQVMPRNQIEDIITLIKDKCDVTTGSEDSPLAYTTGVGGDFFKATFETGTGVSTKVVAEFDCFIRAFTAMSKIKSREELFLPEMEDMKDITNVALGMMESIKDMSPDSIPQTKLGDFDWNDVDATADVDMSSGCLRPDEPLFPCLIAMCGSAAAVLKVGADGDYSLPQGIITMGGRMFLGLCAALTGVKDFSSLTDLIRSGSGRTVDVFSDELKAKEDTENDFYKALPDDMPVFYFSKALTESKESLNPEDMVVSLLHAFSENIANKASDAAHRLNIRRIYFCGNFTEVEKVREFIATTIIQNFSMKPLPLPRFEFIRDGGMLGALGAFMEAHRLKTKSETNSEKAD